VLMMRWVVKALRGLWWKLRPAPAQVNQGSVP
jgi:hypothetical protein